jgi:hypothetical protein
MEKSIQGHPGILIRRRSLPPDRSIPWRIPRAYARCGKGLPVLGPVCA